MLQSASTSSPSTSGGGASARRPVSRRAFVAAAAAAGGVALGAASTARAALSMSEVIGSIADKAQADPAPAANAPAAAPQTARRPLLLQGLNLADEDAVAPSIPWYDVAPDFGNVVNIGDAYFNDAQLGALYTNGFFVMRESDQEFFGTYESNRYNLFPNFVTVDAMTHTYHLYFSHLLKNTERAYLAQLVGEVTQAMVAASAAQLDAVRGTQWESAALRNLGFFSVAAVLLDPAAPVAGEVAGQVWAEYDLIMAAAGISASPLLGKDEDYSQYLVRGYYEGDPALEAYFRTMMWYGRMNFLQSDEDLDRSALLMVLALDAAAAEPAWEKVYTVTAFFAGASDDNGYFEYLPLVQQAYGAKVSAADLPGNDAAWQQFHQLTAALPAPQISSVPVEDDGADSDHLEQTKGFRFMGQRFSLDAAIFTELLYNRVGENAFGEKRLLPDALDVPAALGSDAAAALLEYQGAFAFAGYAENLQGLRDSIAAAPDALWTASLYSQWLHMLRPLTEPRGEGYLPFMQTDLWARKNLQSFLGSYAELKHDMVLYSKQVMAEMGGGPLEERDDRGYVEPEPRVFGRLAALVQATSAGLAGYGLLGEEDAYNLGLLQELAARLQAIAAKELRNELPTEDEFELIRSFGGQIEHFWQEVYKNEADDPYFTTRDFPAAVITDIATDPNGRVLEVGTGPVSTLYVVVPVDGVLRLASGSVYSFYQFEQPIDQRLTDTQWRQMLGIQAGEDGWYGEPQVWPAGWTDDFSLNWRTMSW